MFVYYIDKRDKTLVAIRTNTSPLPFSKVYPWNSSIIYLQKSLFRVLDINPQNRSSGSQKTIWLKIVFFDHWQPYLVLAINWSQCLCKKWRHEKTEIKTIQISLQYSTQQSNFLLRADKTELVASWTRLVPIFDRKTLVSDWEHTKCGRIQIALMSITSY